MVEHLQANREIISTSTNFLDRYIGAQLAAGGGAAAAPPSFHPSLLTPSTPQLTYFSPSTSPSLSSSAFMATPLAVPKAFPPLMDQSSYEHTVVCALTLGLKMHQGDHISHVSHRLSPLTSNPLSPRGLCELEFRMIGALGRRLNPPTAGTLIHHLLHFLPERR